MTIEQKVKEHYGRDGIAEQILLEIGKREGVTPEDLAPYDEMHVGGREATRHFADQLGFKTGTNILDIGCGIGGAARYIAQMTGAQITAIDLTPEFIETAAVLTKAAGLADNITFTAGSTLSLSFPAQSFDGAYMIHVGMNIEEKNRLYNEISRVLKPGAVFGIYDILGDQETESFDFPVPWAGSRETSFLLPPARVRPLLNDAGFIIEREENRRDFALSVFEKMRQMEAAGKTATPPIRSGGFAEKVKNLAGNVAADLCSPWEIICRKM